MWKQRVASWRASGQSAERFSAGRGFAASTLKWWASELRDSVPIVRMAQVIRSSSDNAVRARGAVVVEQLDTRVRITIEPGGSVLASAEAGADRETFETVLALVCPSRASR